MNKLKNNAWFRKVGMALLDIVLILLSVYLSMELRFEMYIPSLWRSYFALAASTSARSALTSGR